MDITVKDVFKVVRNILFNELKVNKADIDRMIQERVDARVEHAVNNYFQSKNLEKMIVKQIMVDLARIRSGGNISYGTTLEDRIRKEIEKQVAEMLRVDLDVSFKANPTLKYKYNTNVDESDKSVTVSKNNKFWASQLQNKRISVAHTDDGKMLFLRLDDGTYIYFGENGGLALSKTMPEATLVQETENEPVST